ncbi:MIP/aquaporin family protein [Lignipirellula cremea]|uniref:Glycerol uptake facilitator protein n=1 Tax=Lignipirellula cremea TaxID=2528010 RepID=A0A518DX08_9BACT|nr:aquaporin [Lignipirellula cremea]QDU96376.1 Glycerol uptake facilitator protein [Lignipirellula cremea]
MASSTVEPPLVTQPEVAQVAKYSAGQLFLAEALGTFLLVLFGCGSVHAAVLTGAQAGLWQVAIVWGVAIMAAIYVTGAVSGAHINPAITLALAVWGKFSWSKVPLYITAQMVGAFLAAAALFVAYGPYLAAKEEQQQVVRGGPGSIITAMCYGEYFPNPGYLAAGEEPLSAAELEKFPTFVSPPVAFGVELLGTAILALVVFAVTDPRNAGAPAANLAPVFIGLTVAALISILAPLTQACFNPARDLGPRLFAFLAGWGPAAIPGPNGIGFVTVYLVAPILGAIVGAGVYEWGIRPRHDSSISG